MIMVYAVKSMRRVKGIELTPLMVSFLLRSMFCHFA